MKAVLVEDNSISLEVLKCQVEMTEAFSEVICFSGSVEAAAWFEENAADVAFLDIIMDDMDGIELARNIRRTCPSCRLIFCTSSTDYALDAFRVTADGYLTKPITADAIREVLELHEIRPTESDKLITVRCFGNFDVFTPEGLPLKFHYRKAKELLAHLVLRKGATCTTAELSAVLYEDREDSPKLASLMRNLIHDAITALESVGARDVIYRQGKEIAIVPELIDCDYYRFEEGDPAARATFAGEFMNQYPWADATTAYLIRVAD